MKINTHDLEMVLARINRIAGFNNPKWSTVGSYGLDWAYGGVKLVQYVSAGGGERDITSGYDTKKNTYNKMQAFLSGMESRTK